MSTGRSSTINQALGIALIVFVMLTFILTVTTYLFFGQKYVAEQELQKKQQEVEQKANESMAASDKEKELRELLGFGEAATIDEMREEFAKLFPDYEGESKAFLPLSKWLDEARKAKDQQLDAAQKAQAVAEGEKAKAEKAVADAEAKHQAELKTVSEKLQSVESEAMAQKDKSDADRKALLEEKEKALAESNAMKLIVEAIDKGQGLVKPPRTFEGKTPAERATVLQDTIRDRNRTIEALERTEFLRTLAATDPRIQLFVLKAIRSGGSDIEELKRQIDGLAKAGEAEQATRIDGRVVAVDQREQTVTIACDATFGIRTGLVFNVHSGALRPGNVLPVKAIVEVVGVDGSSLVRARVRRDSIEDPILVGDTVSTPLWSPGKAIEVVIVGVVDLDGDGRDGADESRLADMVRQIGGTVARSVSPSTTVVVDAGLGSSGDRAAGGGPKAADEKRLKEQLGKAKELGVRTLSLDEFLAWLGQERPVRGTQSVLVPGVERVPETRPGASD